MHLITHSRTKLKTLRPISMIAFYHGLQQGFYFGFLTLYTNWLFVLMLISGAFYIFSLIYDLEYQKYLPFLPIFIGIWSSIFLRMWKRREQELAYSFDVSQEEFSKTQRSDYFGKVKLEEVTNKIVKFNSFTPFKKRLIVSPTTLNILT